MGLTRDAEDPCAGCGLLVGPHQCDGALARARAEATQMLLQADNLALQAELVRKEAELLRKDAELRLLQAQHLATIDNLVMARSRRRPPRAATSRRAASERPSTVAV